MERILYSYKCIMISGGLGPKVLSKTPKRMPVIENLTLKNYKIIIHFYLGSNLFYLNLYTKFLRVFSYLFFKSLK